MNETSLTGKLKTNDNSLNVVKAVDKLHELCTGVKIPANLSRLNFATNLLKY